MKDYISEFAVCDVGSGDCVRGDLNNNNSNRNNVNPSNRDHDNNGVANQEINRLELLEEALKESIALTVQAELQVRLKEEALTMANSKVIISIHNNNNNINCIILDIAIKQHVALVYLD